MQRQARGKDTGPDRGKSTLPSAVERVLVDTLLWNSFQDAADAVLDGDDVDDQTQADADRFTVLRVGLTSRNLSEEMV